ncbi:MAG TPA: DnaA regulatory inactivator Hda [Gammaproteobacteria bacterium]|nr:DnaA regulatory inactivator Hda [Gammaproteobacteria bacterium]
MSAGSDRWRQQTLALFRDAGASFDGFEPAGNREALAAARAWAAGEGPWCLFLWGAAGVGKSHLLQAAVRESTERGARAMYLPLFELRGWGTDALDGLEALDALALDDVDALLGERRWEDRLFALYNRVQSAGGRLIFSAPAAPRELGGVLADLQSRLSAALVFHLVPLDDDARCAALVHAAAGRGIALPPVVAIYLLRRLPRDWAALNTALDTLDAASLSAGRPLTIPFVREALGSDDRSS